MICSCDTSLVLHLIGMSINEWTQISKLSTGTKLHSICSHIWQDIHLPNFISVLSQWHVKWPLDEDLLSEQQTQTQTRVHFYVLLSEKHLFVVYSRRPRRPPFLLVESDGIGVTSSEQTKEKNKMQLQTQYQLTKWLFHIVDNIHTV